MVIGGGPAGLSASVYAARKRLNALLLSTDIGGQVNLTMGIENYIGYQFIEGPELIAKFQEQVGHYPLEQKIGTKVALLEKNDDGFTATTEAGDKEQSKVAVLASGKRPRQLGVPGEVEYTGKGVTYCAVCDGPIFSGQRVLVVGGGNSALEAALDMVKIAEHVDMVSMTPLTGDAVLIEKLNEAKNLDIHLEHQVEKIEGETFVNRVLVKDNDSGQTRQHDVTGVFIEIGLVPNAELVKDLLKLNETGEVPVNAACETEISGLYAAGDVTSVPEKQIVVAAGEGAKAALQAHRYWQRST